MATDPVIVVGGGPAGMMVAMLLARAGVAVTVLEKHEDFFRDFRGDTVHPSTLELFAELGLLDALLERPHQCTEKLSLSLGGHVAMIADFRHLRVPARFMAMMPQWEFLDFLRTVAIDYPGFTLRLAAEVRDVLLDATGWARGVRLADGTELAARLVIAADGRASIVRRDALLPLRDLGAPIDVLWFRLPKLSGAGPPGTAGTIEPGSIVVQIDRGDYWQSAFVIAKGDGDRIRAEGIERFRERLCTALPGQEEAIATLADFDAVKQLTVALDRLEHWSRPGLLAIGDAAHAMSPVGGVGINLAIQDAVAAANLLAAPLARGEEVASLLHRVQARRRFPTRVIQSLQRAAHRRLLSPVLASSDQPVPHWPVDLFRRIPFLARLPARLIGLGIRREHIRSPLATANNSQR